jgi:phosphonate transport system substrate-binding protein
MTVPRTPSRLSARFLLPPSLGPLEDAARAAQLAGHLSGTFAKTVEVGVAPSYALLARELLAGRVDAAWAPPFVCARLEAMGVRILLRGVRHGAGHYRAALLGRAGAGASLEALAGARAAWVDRHSTGGYLLARGLLQARGLVGPRALGPQRFLGSYRAALGAVLAGEADVTSIYAPPPWVEGPTWADAVEALLPGRARHLALLGHTAETPADGVALAMGAPPRLAALLEEALLALPGTEEGRGLLRDTFDVERFEPAPRLGYRTLYREAHADGA